MRMFYNQEEGCDIRQVPLSTGPFFSLWDCPFRAAQGAASWAAAEPRPSLPVAPHSPRRCRGQDRHSHTALLLPSGEIALAINFIIRFSKKFSREREEFQPLTSQQLCQAAESPVKLLGVTSRSAKASH